LPPDPRAAARAVSAAAPGRAAPAVCALPAPATARVASEAFPITTALPMMDAIGSAINETAKIRIVMVSGVHPSARGREVSRRPVTGFHRKELKQP